MTAAKKPHDAQFSESSAVWFKERLSMEKKEESARTKLLADLVMVRRTAPRSNPVFFMEKKYFCLGQARLNRGVFICAALEYSGHVYLRLMGNIN